MFESRVCTNNFMLKFSALSINTHVSFIRVYLFSCKHAADCDMRMLHMVIVLLKYGFIWLILHWQIQDRAFAPLPFHFYRNLDN